MEIYKDRPWDLFEYAVSGEWNTSGLDVQWRAQLMDGVPCLAFQGSRSKTDWLNNFRFAVRPYKGQKSMLKVHTGYATAWKSCNDEVMDALMSLYRLTNRAPVITGHSFGGAMAVLAAEDFFFRTGVKPALVTFGAPKALWGRYSKIHVATCCGEVFQYAQRNDIVTICPPLPGYRHLRKVKIGKKWNLFKMFDVGHHQMYGEEKEYA